jgi:HEAT repeat protein
VRQAAVNSLGLLNAAAARETVEKLLDSDPDVKVRATAATTLGSFKTWESRNLLLAVARKTAEDNSVRANALMSLARMGKPEVIGDLGSMLQDPSIPIRQAALNATAQINDPLLTAPLRKVLTQDADMRCRSSAAYQLGKLKAKEAEEDLIKAWSSTDGGLRQNALSALQGIGSVRIVEFAGEALNDKHGGLRQAGISIFAALKHKPAAEEVLAIAAKEKDGGMRVAAMRALPALAPGVDSCELLLNALADPAEQIRSTAYTTLCSVAKQSFPFRSWAYPHRREVEVAKWRDWWTKEGKAALQAMQN